MLKISNLKSFYGHAMVLHDVDIEIEKGQVVALLGPNGAGKTTTMMSISGMVRMAPETSILFEEKEISHYSSSRIVKLGITQCPQGRGVFPGLTVRENLVMGAYMSHDKKQIEQDLEKNLEMFPRLKERIKQQAGTLSGGE